MLATVILDVGRLLVELRRPREALPWLSAFLAMRPNHQEAQSLWRLADSQVGNLQTPYKADVDPEIVAKIGAAIRSQHSGANSVDTTCRCRGNSAS